MANREQRRLIKFGNSSFIVALPKEWIKRNKLKKGDLIHFSENTNNELVLSSGEEKEKEIRSLIINVDDKDIKDLKREVNSAYINNYDEIILEGKKIGKREEELLKSSIGIEVFEKSPQRIILRDILDFEVISIEKMLKRLDNTLRSMFEDIKSGLKYKKLKDSILNEIIKSDEEVNKLYFLLLKIIRKCQGNIKILKMLKTDSRKLSDLQWIVLHMEYLGDELKRIARILNSKKFALKDRESIVMLISYLERNYVETLSCYYSYDKKSARRIAGAKENSLKLLEKNFRRSNSKELTIISEKMKWISLYIHNFAKIVAY